jgi:hypothetical protein
VLQFGPGGTYASKEGEVVKLSGIYQLYDDVLQISANTPRGIRRIELTIINLDAKEMHLLSAHDSRMAYRKVAGP